MLGPLPVTVLNYTSGGAAAELTKLLRKRDFDIVQIEGVHLVEYLRMIRSVSPRSAIVADWHNVESEIMGQYAQTSTSLARRIVARRTASLIRAAENRLLRESDVNSVVSDRDRSRLLERDPLARIQVVPNGVDVDYYRRRADVRPADAAWDLLFVGSMDYHANIDGVLWFAREIWPAIRQRFPGICFHIAGRDPSAEIVALACRDIIVSGNVEDVRPFYWNAAALIVPLRVGGGTRLKILEAMAARLPVISTSLGAEGLNVSAGENILLADTATEMIQSIEALREKPEGLSRIVDNASRLVTEQYDWIGLGEILHQVHEDALASRLNEAAANRPHD
jgi:glycosyltransferase involved in cell wall biosynthesis